MKGSTWCNVLSGVMLGVAAGVVDTGWRGLIVMMLVALAVNFAIVANELRKEDK